ncbi:hypothetical protein RASY3_12635 [Ruminococcus albus SY3]|uniref:Lipoprotein n=1 Tax=Ruminococcus albus SY3 TaxID=1341156 RepID=A0A011UYY0_RUMAL|nr:hypothetical protein [Ruminococcus albus]EXM38407.1 hypothetical protein RASY3_12635 [Ruminococcus albus SY3]
MKTKKTRIIIAAAIAAVSMAALTGCSGTYSVDEKTGAVNISPAEAKNAAKSTPAYEADVKEEITAETSSATEDKAEENNFSNGEESSVPVHTVQDSPVPVQQQNETTPEVTIEHENTADVDTSVLYQYASTAVEALNSAGYNASGLQVRWANGTSDENFEPCEGILGSFRYYNIGDYGADYLQTIRDNLYGGYLSENICNTYGLYKAENAIVEHDGLYYYDANYMGTGNYDLFECIEGSINVIDADTYTVDAMHKDAMNISGEGRKCVITLKKVNGTDSWQIDSVQDL